MNPNSSASSSLWYGSAWTTSSQSNKRKLCHFIWLHAPCSFCVTPFHWKNPYVITPLVPEAHFIQNAQLWLFATSNFTAPFISNIFFSVDNSPQSYIPVYVKLCAADLSKSTNLVTVFYCAGDSAVGMEGHFTSFINWRLRLNCHSLGTSKSETTSLHGQLLSPRNCTQLPSLVHGRVLCLLPSSTFNLKQRERALDLSLSNAYHYHKLAFTFSSSLSLSLSIYIYIYIYIF
jgi:hypothetical protein